MVKALKIKAFIICGGDQTLIEPLISFLAFIEKIKIIWACGSFRINKLTGSIADRNSKINYDD